MLNKFLTSNNNDYFDFFNNDIFHPAFFAKNNDLPPVNIKEDETGFEIEIAAPGFGKENFNVSLDKDVLTISGKKEVETKRDDRDDKKKTNWCRREYSLETFQRSFTLPADVDKDNISGDYVNGILKLTLPRGAASVAKAITIK